MVIIYAYTYVCVYTYVYVYTHTHTHQCALTGWMKQCVLQVLSRSFWNLRHLFSSSSSSSSCSWRVRCFPCSLILKVELVPPSLKLSVSLLLHFEDFTSSVCCPLDGLPACRRVSLVVGLPPWSL